MVTCLLAPSLSLNLALLPLLPSFHQDHLPSVIYISFLCFFTNYSLNLHNLPWKSTLPPLPIAYSKCFLPVLNIFTPQAVCARAHQALSWNHSYGNRHCPILLAASLPHLSQHLYLFLALLPPPLSNLTSLLNSHLKSPSPHPTLTSLCLAWDTCAPFTSPNLLFLQTCLFLYIVHLYVCVCLHLVTQSCPTLCDPMELSRLLCPWNFPGKNTGVGCCFLLQGIFLTLGSHSHLLSLLHCRQILYPLSHWLKTVPPKFHLILR